MRSLATAVLLLAAAGVAGADDPLIVTDTHVITEPCELGEVIVAAGGSLQVIDVPDPGVRFSGHVMVLGGSEIVLRESTIQFMSAYHGQYALVGAESGRIEVEGCDYRVPSGVQHAVFVIDDALAVVEDTNFDFVQLISAGDARLEARRLNGEFEVILQDDSSMVLEDIPRDPGGGSIWVWPEFPAGSTAVYSPPMPGFIDSWSFPPWDASGIEQSCVVDRCEVKLWPLLVREGADLTLRDIDEDNWIVVGLHMPSSARVEHLENDTTYDDRDLGLAHHDIVLDNASIDTWNLYPQAEAHVRVADCVLGEILGMESSTVLVERTIIDGTGGYFGVGARSYVVVRDSTLTCDVVTSSEGTLILRDSSALPYPHDPTGEWTRFAAHDSGRILVDQTVVDTTVQAGGDGLIAVAALADPPVEPPGPGESVTLSGWIGQYSPEGGPADGGSWRVEAVPLGSRARRLIAEGEDEVDGAEIGVWSGADPAQPYEIRIVFTDAWGRTLAARRPVPPGGGRAPFRPQTPGPRPSDSSAGVAPHRTPPAPRAPATAFAPAAGPLADPRRLPPTRPGGGGG